VREVSIEPTLESWRVAARRLIAEGVQPADVIWREELPASAPGLFEPSSPVIASGSPEAPELRVPRAFVALANAVAPAADPERWRLLYSVLWRIAQGDRDLLLRRDDPDLQRLRALAEAAPPSAAPFVPKGASLDELARAAQGCRGCDLYRDATQTVFGKGPAAARAVLVGEQPGDQEDLRGAPFVGPAGEVLDRALVEAGLPRADVYVTNAVKHFKFLRTPKRRIHQTPGPVEIGACRPWLEAELAIVQPRVLVCLGATASKALLGPEFRLLKNRGRFLESHWAPKVLATYHPSAVLRADTDGAKQEVYGALLSDLRLVAGELASLESRR
jgi:uracil-DNA glycosylase